MPNTRGPDTATAIICVNNDHNYSPSIDPFGEGFQCIDRGDPRTTEHCSSCGTCVCRGCKFHVGGMVPEWSLQSLTFLDERLQPSPITPKDERRFRRFRTIFQKNPRKHFHVNPASGMREAGLAPEDILEIKHLGWCKTITQYIQEVHRRKNYQQLLSGPFAVNLHRFAAEPEKFEVLPVQIVMFSLRQGRAASVSQSHESWQALPL
ncbi:hypothetical protein C1H76_3852 [Elsinoe australis]|uniref:Uncharacterized protein n=1 Tax=Elsinoe australis TaxID=40998 RepID=A0A4U7B718_9PEZI|nr:hypothetical protein C1H76_3852 [Elsinoe australis]